MDEENKSYENDLDFPENFDDAFEIGIPVDVPLRTQPPPESPDTEVDQEVDQEVDAEVDTEVDQEDTAVKKIAEKDIPDEESSGLSPFDEIKEQLKDLSQAFESKLKYDEHKNKTIDDLHQSLQGYREGLVKKYLHRIITDIIKIVDDMRKFTSHNKKLPASDETTEKLFKYIENIASDLEDLFSWEGVVSFTCNGDLVDTSRQRVLDRIETDDPAKDKTVAERLRPGYEWDGKVIRPEMVSAYIYQTESTAEDNNN